nr:MAG TPA: hypothetical protein [Caudoviricetes sp.]
MTHHTVFLSENSTGSDQHPLFIIYHTPKKNAIPDSKQGDNMEIYFKIETTSKAREHHSK